MIIPSIDLQDGSTVQLIGGKEKALDLGDPIPWARRFGLVGEIAVIDLDAAMRRGSNKNVTEGVVRTADCRVGGGIRSNEQALFWLDRGATKVILGTAATPELLSQLPRERVMAAVDAVSGEVVVEGWQKKTGKGLLQQISLLKEYVSGFLVTFVEREGRLQGIDLDYARQVIEAAAPARVTIAGGVTTLEEVAALDRMGADAQVGMALYTKRFSLAEAFAAPLMSDRADGLWPTLVCDESGAALGLAYSNIESLSAALETQKGVYFSRRRGLWVKGETSGATQELLSVRADCDRDCLRFIVRQRGGFCHSGSRSCFGDARGLTSMQLRLQDRASADAASYTMRLLSDKQLLAAKLREEADEFAAAESPQQAISEAADLLYFLSTGLLQWDVPVSAVEDELRRRERKVSRRPGDAKPAFVRNEVC